MEIQIGHKFVKPLNKGKSTLCEVVDVIKRISTRTGEILDEEYYAKSIDGVYFYGKSFEVSKTTIIRGSMRKSIE